MQHHVIKLSFGITKHHLCSWKAVVKKHDFLVSSIFMKTAVNFNRVNFKCRNSNGCLIMADHLQIYSCATSNRLLCDYSEAIAWTLRKTVTVSCNRFRKVAQRTIWSCARNFFLSSAIIFFSAISWPFLGHFFCAISFMKIVLKIQPLTGYLLCFYSLYQILF